MACQKENDCCVEKDRIVGCGCKDNKSSEIVYRHRRERLYVGSGTNEFILSLGRTAVDPSKIEDYLGLDIYKYNDCQKNKLLTTIHPYALSDSGDLHFDLSGGEFLTDDVKFPKGMYVAQLMLENCVVDTIEVVKAPSFFVLKGRAEDNRCKGDTGYVEPCCSNTNAEVKPQEEKHQGCSPCEALHKNIVQKKTSVHIYS